MFCAQCYGNEKWGDWRPHLAVMLSNETGDPAVQQKAIVTMGDTLGIDALTGCNAVSAQILDTDCFCMFFHVQPPKASYMPPTCAI